MSITQTVEVPASHRLVIDVPREVPAVKAVIVFTSASEDREIDFINHNAEILNREAADALSFQSLDAFEEDLERLAPRELAVVNGAAVPFSFADIIFDRDNERLKSVSEEEHPA
jgi:hypothetical protein